MTSERGPDEPGESLKCGWGGGRNITALLGIAPPPSPTAGGNSSSAMSRSTRPGAPAVDRDRRKTPEVVARTEAAMAHGTAGEPASGPKRTRRTTARLADEPAYPRRIRGLVSDGLLKIKTSGEQKRGRRVERNRS